MSKTPISITRLDYKDKKNFSIRQIFFFKNREPQFYDRSQPILSCEGWIRTTDLKVMSLPSYHCSTSRYILNDYFPLPHGHLSTSCAGCTSGCNQYFNVKELQIKNPTSYKGFLKRHTRGICFTKIRKNSHSVKSFFIMKRFGVFVLSDMNI